MTRWRAAVFLLFLFNGVGTGTWASRTPAIADGLGIGIIHMGGLVTALPVGSIVAILVSSHVLHALHVRATMRLALLVSSLGLASVGVAVGVVHSYPLAFAAFVVYGFGNSLANVSLNVEAAEIDRAGNRTLLPLFHATWSIGTFAGAGLGALASLGSLALPVHFALAAALLVVGSVFFVSLFPAVEPDAPRHAPTTFAERTRVWVEPRTLLLGVMVLGAAFTEGTATNWIALSMVEERGFSASAAAVYFTVFTASMTVGRLVGGGVVDRFGRVATLRTCFALAGVGVLVVVFFASPAAIVVGVVLWGLGSSLGYPLGVSAAADDPVNSAARVSAVAAVASIAFLSGPSIIGILGEHVGLLGAFLLVVVLLIVALSVSRAARRPALSPPA